MALDHKQKQALQALWLKAGKSPESLALPCGTRKEALRIRLALYRAVEHVRKNPEVDRELAEAVANCSISFDEKEEGTIWIGKGHASTKIGELLAKVGITEADVKSKEERDLEAAQKRFQERIAEGEVKPAADGVTKYYTR